MPARTSAQLKYGDQPARIGSLLFCRCCGSLLNLPADDDEITCDECGFVESASAYENLKITTKSHPDAFPSALRQKKALVVTKVPDAGGPKKGAEIDEECPSCGHDRATFTTLQLRSADEGSTVFYECVKCGHSWSQNN